jgi:small subunit ribosomal protein S20
MLVSSLRHFALNRYRPVSTSGSDLMANTSSAKKATRVAARRAVINKDRTSRVRTSVRKVEEALSANDKAAAEAALRAAEPELMRGAQKGILHKNAAARKVSRLAKRVKAIR